MRGIRNPTAVIIGRLAKASVGLLDLGVAPVPELAVQPVADPGVDRRLDDGRRQGQRRAHDNHFRFRYLPR